VTVKRSWSSQTAILFALTDLSKEEQFLGFSHLPKLLGRTRVSKGSRALGGEEAGDSAQLGWREDSLSVELETLPALRELQSEENIILVFLSGWSFDVSRA